MPATKIQDPEEFIRYPFGPLPDEPILVIEAFWNYDHWQGDRRKTYGERHLYATLEDCVLDFRKAKRRRALKDRPSSGFYFIRETPLGKDQRRRWGKRTHENYIDKQFTI